MAGAPHASAERDRLEQVPVTNLYYSLCWVSLLLAIGLFNAELMGSEKGFYAMAFLLALFGAVTVQKNVRDMAALRGSSPLDGDSELPGN